MVYGDLLDLQAACTEASPQGKIKDFEVGVFCGKYKTQIPDGYFEHLNQMRGKKPQQVARQPQASGNSGPVGSAASGSPTVVDGINGEDGVAASTTSRIEPRSPTNREDIR